MTKDQRKACVEGYESWWNNTADMQDAYTAGFKAGLEQPDDRAELLAACQEAQRVLAVVALGGDLLSDEWARVQQQIAGAVRNATAK